MSGLRVGYRFFGQVISRAVGKLTDFDLRTGKDFRKWAAHPHPILLGVCSEYPVGPQVKKPTKSAT